LHILAQKVCLLNQNQILDIKHRYFRLPQQASR
jgi:hypothetical protein